MTMTALVRGAAVAAIALTVTGCAATSTDGRSIASRPSCYPGLIPQSDGRCLPPPIDPNAGPRSNVAYRDYAPATPGLHRVGDPLATRLQPVLRRLRGPREPTEAAVKTAITVALPGYDVVVSSQAARVFEGVGYAISISADGTPGCIHGWAGASTYKAEVSGTTRGEGCLPLLGH